jgi:arginyl-tRNA--protein-N-Asp/Glu arginylyltransferase
LVDGHVGTDHRAFDRRVTAGAGDPRRTHAVPLSRGAHGTAPAAPDCAACEPIRLDVEQFTPGRTQRRVFRRGERELKTEIGRLEPTLEKVNLYNRHKFGRGLNTGDQPIDLEGYRAFLGESCCDTFELRYRIGRKLVGLAIVDRSEHALSAVYCFFDPMLPQLGIGTYSILKQVDLCKQWGLRWLYLGLYIAECSSMAYKSRFLPHERLLDGRWVTLDRADVPEAPDAPERP